MFFGQACTVVATNIFEWIPALGTYERQKHQLQFKLDMLYIKNVEIIKLTVRGDATAVTQAGAEGAPIQAVQQYVQHLCPPSKIQLHMLRSVASILVGDTFNTNLLEKQDDAVSKVAHTPRFSAPIRESSADTLYTHISNSFGMKTTKA